MLKSMFLYHSVTDLYLDITIVMMQGPNKQPKPKSR